MGGSVRAAALGWAPGRAGGWAGAGIRRVTRAAEPPVDTRPPSPGSAPPRTWRRSGCCSGAKRGLQGVAGGRSRQAGTGRPSPPPLAPRAASSPALAALRCKGSRGERSAPGYGACGPAGRRRWAGGPLPGYARSPSAFWLGGRWCCRGARGEWERVDLPHARSSSIKEWAFKNFPRAHCFEQVGAPFHGGDTPKYSQRLSRVQSLASPQGPAPATLPGLSSPSNLLSQPRRRLPS